MFTGIVETIGAVEKNRNGRLEVVVSAGFGKGIKAGASVAVNGACLTLIQKSKCKNQNENVKCKMLQFDVIPETLRCSNLGLIKEGDFVNLERALKADGRFEGHIVQGHVDAIAQIQKSKIKMQNNGRDVIIYIQIPKGLEKYIVPKGSVAVDGVSLTVVDVVSDYFTVAVIPHTLENTIAQFYKKGSIVNIEVDILAKYVDRLGR